MSARPSTNPLTREAQIQEAVQLVRGLLGDRDANKVSVRVTPGGTYQIDAEAEGAKVAGHNWGTGRAR